MTRQQFLNNASIVGALITLSTLMAILNTSAHAKDAPHANIIDGLTYADTCLYMLESTRQLEQPDCDRLFVWHQENLPHLPLVENINDAQRARFERNRKLYLSTVRRVQEILASKVTRQ